MIYYTRNDKSIPFLLHSLRVPTIMPQGEIINAWMKLAYVSPMSLRENDDCSVQELESCVMQRNCLEEMKWNVHDTSERNTTDY